jgi:hypothetical protein
MRRLIASTLFVAALPVGVGVGLLLALHTYLPYCPVRGLGTLALCAARSSFQPSFCAACGAVAAIVVLLLAVASARVTARI